MIHDRNDPAKKAKPPNHPENKTNPQLIAFSKPELCSGLFAPPSPHFAGASKSMATATAAPSTPNAHAPASSAAADQPIPPPHTGRGFVVQVKEYHAVAQWHWDAGDDVCGICRVAFEGCPPGAKFPGDDSPVVWGKCAHAFHLQCITKWLAQPQGGGAGAGAEPKCPICRRTWEFKEAEMARDEDQENGGDEDDDDDDDERMDVTDAMP